MDNIHAQFFLKKNEFVLDVNVKIPTTGTTALFGLSGSGKTSLLRCIAGLEYAKKGQLKIGNDVWQDKDFFRPVHQRSVAYVFQDSLLFSHLSIEQNLRYGFSRAHHQQNPIESTIELLGIADLLSKNVTQLSGGERQRVAIARALLSQPKLILMDEPLANLDYQSKAEILPYLDNLRDHLKIPMIYVSHSLDEVVRIADYMVLINQGKVQAQGKLNELLTRGDLPLAYFDEACAVIDGSILRHEPEYHLSIVNISGGSVAISQRQLDLGSHVRLRISAKDVSISLLPAQHTSINNSISACITAIDPSHDPARVLLTLVVGPEKQSILAQITVKSLKELGLEKDKIVYAQIKSVALMR